MLKYIEKNIFYISEKLDKAYQELNGEYNNSFYAYTGYIMSKDDDEPSSEYEGFYIEDFLNLIKKEFIQKREIIKKYE